MSTRAPGISLAGFEQAVGDLDPQLLLFSTLRRQGLCQTRNWLIKVVLALLLMMQSPCEPESE